MQRTKYNIYCKLSVNDYTAFYKTVFPADYIALKYALRSESYYFCLANIYITIYPFPALSLPNTSKGLPGFPRSHENKLIIIDLVSFHQQFDHLQHRGAHWYRFYLHKLQIHGWFWVIFLEVLFDDNKFRVTYWNECYYCTVVPSTWNCKTDYWMWHYWELSSFWIKF